MEKTLRSLLSPYMVPAHCAKASPWLEWGRGWESGPGQGEEAPLPGEVIPLTPLTAEPNFSSSCLQLRSVCPQTLLPAVEALREAAALLPSAAPGAEGPVFLERSEAAGSCVTPKFRGHHAVRAPHVPLKSQSSVCVHCLWMCVPLNCMSRVWVRVDCKKSALAKCRQPLVHAESSNLLSIRWSVSQRGLTEQ